MIAGKLPNGIPIDWARQAATLIYTQMEPFCTKVRIAGSIRRKKGDPNATVKDIEIVAVPRWTEETDPTDLFGEKKVHHNELFEKWALVQSDIQWIKPGTEEIVPWQVKPEGKYWRGYLSGMGCKLDLFLTTPEQFGLIYLIRTGPAKFSEALVTYARRIGFYVEDGWLWDRRQGAVEDDGVRIDTPTERAVFDAMKLEWIEPQDRRGPEDIKARRHGKR